jgi:AcrR family transcriptional regulator
MRRFDTHAADDQETRQRLLDAAIHLFSENGFKKVTVRDLCHRAHANVAAVNYHFGDKSGLYLEAFRLGVEDAKATNAEAQAAGAGKPPEEKLRAFLQVFMHRLNSPKRFPWLQRMMTHEMVDPTPALDLMIDEVIRPRLDYLSRIVADLLHCPVADPRVLRCANSISAQMFIYFWKSVSERVLQAKVTENEVDALTEHILEFSLAGIRALRDANAIPVATSSQRRAARRR